VYAGQSHQRARQRKAKARGGVSNTSAFYSKKASKTEEKAGARFLRGQKGLAANGLTGMGTRRAIKGTDPRRLNQGGLLSKRRGRDWGEKNL